MKAYEVTARNTATDSANKIHDDEVARQYGFSGGLVPGVVVHAYLTHPPAAEWGRPWVEGGTISSRFHQPVYDGDRVEVTVLDDGQLEIRTPAGDVAAVATVGKARGTGDVPPDLGRWPHRALPAPRERPRASAEAFAANPVFGSLDVHFRADKAHIYLEAIGETLPLYEDEGIAHPGWLIAQANYVLGANVLLGPWIHVGSEVTHLGLVRDGDLVSTRARVVETTERKGHKFVDLDVLIVNGDEEPVLRARHLAIYEPRTTRPS
jgi:acyl dehydratase